jgi:hypothetical protein
MYTIPSLFYNPLHQLIFTVLDHPLVPQPRQSLDPHFFDETGGEAPTEYIFNYKSNQKQYRGSRNKKSKVKIKNITHKLLAM